MIKVVQLYPQPPVRRPFCEATLSEYVATRNAEWRERHKKDPHRLNRLEREKIANGIPAHQCGCLAKYTINGKFFCRKHGALIALDLVAKELDQRK